MFPDFPEKSFWHYDSDLHFVLKAIIWDILQIMINNFLTNIWCTLIIHVSIFDVAKGLPSCNCFFNFDRFQILKKITCNRCSSSGYCLLRCILCALQKKRKVRRSIRLLDIKVIWFVTFHSEAWHMYRWDLTNFCFLCVKKEKSRQID